MRHKGAQNWYRSDDVHLASAPTVFMLQVAMLASVILGFATAEVGISIQHDANHGAFSRYALPHSPAQPCDHTRVHAIVC
jgi:hypothetical protein